MKVIVAFRTSITPFSGLVCLRPPPRGVALAISSRLFEAMPPDIAPKGDALVYCIPPQRDLNGCALSRTQGDAWAITSRPNTGLERVRSHLPRAMPWGHKAPI
jgi:hypothetical protein